jgi:hypothetical protein
MVKKEYIIAGLVGLGALLGVVMLSRSVVAPPAPTITAEIYDVAVTAVV